MPEDIASAPAPTPAPTALAAAEAALQTTSAPAAPEEGKDPLNVAKRFEVLSRREAKLAEERALTKSEKAAFAAEREALLAKVAEAEEIKGLKSKFKQSPAELLKWAELSFDDLVKYQLESEKNALPPAVAEKIGNLEEQVKAEREARENEAKAREKATLERQQRELQEHIKFYQEDVEAELTKNADKYEFLSVRNAASEVFTLVETWFEETEKATGKGEILSPTEALDRLEQQYEEEAKSLFKTKKIQRLFDEHRKGASVKDNTTDVRETKKPSLTLRNSPSAAPVVTQSSSNTSSSQDRINRAAALIKHT